MAVDELGHDAPGDVVDAEACARQRDAFVLRADAPGQLFTKRRSKNATAANGRETGDADLE